MAGKPTASFDITANDQTKSGITSAKNNVEGLAKSAVASTAKMVAGWGAAFLSVQKVVDVVKKSLNTFAIFEKAQLSLIVAAKNNPFLNKDAVKGLMDYNKQLAATTNFTSAALYEQQGFLAAQGKTAEEIKRVMAVAVDWASTGTTTLEGAVRNLSKTYGGFAGELGETVPAIKALTVEQLKAGAAIDIMGQKYRGMAAAMAGSVGGAQASLGKTFETFFTNLGSGLAPVYMAINQKIKPILDKINAWIADNANVIANVFLNLPELASISLSFVEKAIKKAFSFQQIVENIKAAFKYIINIFTTVIKLMASLWSRMGETMLQIIISLAKGIWTVLSSVGKTVWVPLSTGFEWAVYGIRKLWGTMIEGLGNGLDWLIMNPVNLLGKAFYSVVQGIGKMLEFIINGIASLINSVIAPLNDVIYTVSQVTTKGFDTGKWDTKKSAIPSVGKVDFGGGGEWKDLTSSLGKKWEEKLSPPKDRDIGAEIAAIWKAAGSDLSGNMAALVAGLGDTWEGFDGDLKTAFTDIFNSYTDLMGNAVKPWTTAFDEMLPKFKAVLFQKLPFELASAVEKALDGLSDAVPVVDTRTNWEKFVDLMKKIGADSKAALVKAWTAVTGFFSSIPATVGKMWSGIKYAFKNPGEVLSQGFKNILDGAKNTLATGVLGIVDAFNKAKEWLKKPENKEKVDTTVGTAFASVVSWLVSKLLELIQSTQAFQDLMTWINELLATLMNTAVQPLITALMPLLNIIIALVQNVANMLLPIFNMLGVFIQATLPLWLAIGNLLQILGGIIVQLAPIIFVVAQIIAQVLTPIIEALCPLFQLLGLVLTWVMPIIGFFAKVIDAVTRPIEFLCDLFTWTAQIIKTFAENVGIAIWNILHPFRMKSFKSGPGGFSSDAFSRPLIDISDYEPPATEIKPLTMDTAITPPAVVTADTGQAATYGGAKTFNITNTVQAGMIVGEFGMREMVRIFYQLQKDMIEDGSIA